MASYLLFLRFVWKEPIACSIIEKLLKLRFPFRNRSSVAVTVRTRQPRFQDCFPSLDRGKGRRALGEASQVTLSVLYVSLACLVREKYYCRNENKNELKMNCPCRKMSLFFCPFPSVVGVTFGKLSPVFGATSFVASWHHGRLLGRLLGTSDTQYRHLYFPKLCMYILN